MLDIVAATRVVVPADPLPLPVLSELQQLMRCDLVEFVMFDARRREHFVDQGVGDSRLLRMPDTEAQEVQEVFWRTYWDSLTCCYPDVSGDLTTITTVSDFYSDRELRSIPMYCEVMRYIGEREMMVCLPSRPGRVLRLLFWRGPGPDFSQRERDLLTLLRPHLYNAYQQYRQLTLQPQVTARQRQLLSLVAVGQTNAQIARRLSISEATVRKHLEHIFHRLQVTSRTAAVTRVFGGIHTDYKPF
jgi:DNA-binding CsgD family transcriptional regulator